jgi:hypothetical protein
VACPATTSRSIRVIKCRPIDLPDRGIRRVDLLQVEAEHEAMMIRHAAAKHLAQLWGEALIRRSAGRPA